MFTFKHSRVWNKKKCVRRYKFLEVQSGRQVAFVGKVVQAKTTHFKLLIGYL